MKSIEKMLVKYLINLNFYQESNAEKYIETLSTSEKNDLFEALFNVISNRLGISKLKSIKTRPDRLPLLHIIPGFFCNLSCDHCSTNSGPSEKIHPFADSELFEIKECIKQSNPSKILFSGGEPLFYPDLINQICSYVPPENDYIVEVTTNGFFGKDPKLTEKTLSSINKLDAVCLSYDKFHSLKLSEVKNIRDYCLKNDLQFTISVSMTSPLDIIQIQKELGSDYFQFMHYRKVDGTGRAGKNKIHFTYPEFQDSALAKTCPNKDTITYISGKGFSTCCSNLMFNLNSTHIYNKNYNEYIQSEFNQLINTKTLGEIAELANVAVNKAAPCQSGTCDFCQFAHTKPGLK
jgi:MoaA/NifB/PqqE/SkfB family radical SAM enzyme